MSGFTYSYRSKWEHPIFRDLQEASIWAWLCDSAVWKDSRINYCGIMVELARGQLITSRSFISKGFNLGEQRVRSLLARMEKDGMINQLPTSHGTIITICNYSKYQSQQPDTNQEDNQPLTSDQPATNQNKKEGNKGKERNESNISGDHTDFDFGGPADQIGVDSFRHAFPKKAGTRAQILTAYINAKKRGMTDEQLRQHAQRYADYCKRQSIPDQFRTAPAKWLDADGWLNDYETTSSGAGKSTDKRANYGDSILAAAAATRPSD